MTEDHSDFLIKSAALLAKDLLSESGFFSKRNTTITTELDSDDDSDLFFYSQFIKKRKLSEKRNLHREVIAKSEGEEAEVRGPPKNHLFLKFLQECEDNTFENQFKMTRKTFQVRQLSKKVFFFAK